MKYFLSILIVCLSFSVFAQEPSADEVPEKPSFLGFSTGINSKGGMIGVNGNIAITKNIMAGVAAGIGGWGPKVGVNVQYHPRSFYKSYFLLGVTRAAGFPEFEIQLKDINGVSRSFEMILDPVFNVNLAFGRNFKVGKRARFYLEGGYSVKPYSGKSYRLKYSFAKLSKESEASMRIMTPGGLRLSVGFDFAIGGF